jgi:NADP-dependent 3-hydroxy acid dehydrogenase YdfG
VVEPLTPVGIITGAASGIGAATAVEFARLGGRLVLADLPGSGFDEVLTAVRDAGGEGVPAEVDVRKVDDVAQLSRLACDRFGRIDFLFANAGIAEQSSVVDGDPDRWRAVIETNLLGAMYSVRAVLPEMVRQGSGHVILTASLSGRSAYVGEPSYIASKWGLVGFGQALRMEVAPRGIRVTLVEPGLVATPLTRSQPLFRRLLQESEPLLAEDVARIVVFAHTQPGHVDINEIAVRPLRESDAEWWPG